MSISTKLKKNQKRGKKTKNKFFLLESQKGRFLLSKLYPFLRLQDYPVFMLQCRNCSKHETYIYLSQGFFFWSFWCFFNIFLSCWWTSSHAKRIKMFSQKSRTFAKVSCMFYFLLMVVYLVIFTKNWSHSSVWVITG